MPTARSTPCRSRRRGASRTRRWPGSTARCTRPRTAATRPSTGSYRGGGPTRAAISPPAAACCRRSSSAGGRTSTPTPPTPASPTRSSGSRSRSPNPPADTVRVEAQSKGAAIFDRTEGIWSAERSVYFDCTTGGEAQLGQLWEYRPRGRDGGVLTLIYESTDIEDLEGPDNLVVVPHTGDVWLQEDASGEQFVRGVTKRGTIYDFARTALNQTEFCGGTLQHGRQDVLPEPAGRPRRGGARAGGCHLRDLGPVRQLGRPRRRLSLDPVDPG